MSRPDRPSPNVSPPDRFVPQAGQNAALSGICLPQFLQNMPMPFQIEIKTNTTQYHTMKNRKNQPQIETKREKSDDSGGRRGFIGEEPDREIHAVSELAFELRDDRPVRGYGACRERFEVAISFSDDDEFVP